MVLRPLLSTIGLLLVAFIACADDIDIYVREQMHKQRIPGLSLAVVKGGNVVKAVGYGFANLEHKAPATADTVYQLASVSKQFVAAAAMILVEEGKLSLDDDVRTHVEGTPEAWKGITIRMLLAHTAGIKDYTEEHIDYRRDYTEDEFLGRVAKLPLDFPPGARWNYSNTGYVLLGILIRKASGEYHGDFLHRRILAPLEMKSTRVISEADVIPNRAAGYRLVRREIKNQEWVAPSLNTLGDGCLYSTVLDLAKWDAALYTERILKRSSLEAMWTPTRLADGSTRPYGMGWTLDEFRGQRIIEQRGTWQGFRSFVIRHLDDQLTVVILANLATAAAEQMARQVAGLYEPRLARPKPQAVTDAAPDATKELVQFLKGLADPFRLTDRPDTLLSPEERKEWREILENVSPLQSLTLIEQSKAGDGYRCRYLADFREVTLRNDVVLDAGGIIREIRIHQQ